MGTVQRTDTALAGHDVNRNTTQIRNIVDHKVALKTPHCPPAQPLGVIKVWWESRAGLVRADARRAAVGFVHASFVLDLFALVSAIGVSPLSHPSHLPALLPGLIV